MGNHARKIVEGTRNAEADAVSTNYHQDVSPELKEVMHLLQMIETGQDKKTS